MQHKLHVRRIVKLPSEQNLEQQLEIMNIPNTIHNNVEQICR